MNPHEIGTLLRRSFNGEAASRLRFALHDGRVVEGEIADYHAPSPGHWPERVEVETHRGERLDLAPADILAVSEARVDFSPESAVVHLGPPAYLWHSGGGIMLGRVDFDGERHILISDSADDDGGEGWLVGYYEADDGREWDGHGLAVTPDALREVVGRFREGRRA